MEQVLTALTVDDLVRAGNCWGGVMEEYCKIEGAAAAVPIEIALTAAPGRSAELLAAAKLDGYGSGHGDGDGNGYGNGYGDGDGDGYGDGDGSGDGNGGFEA